MPSKKELIELIRTKEPCSMAALEFGIQGYRLPDDKGVFLYVKGDDIYFIHLDCGNCSGLFVSEFLSLIYQSRNRPELLIPHRPVIATLADPDRQYHLVMGYFGYPVDEIVDEIIYEGSYQWYPLNKREASYMVNIWQDDHSDRASIALTKAILASGYQPYEPDRPDVIDMNGEFKYGAKGVAYEK